MRSGRQVLNELKGYLLQVCAWHPAEAEPPVMSGTLHLAHRSPGGRRDGFINSRRESRGRLSLLEALVASQGACVVRQRRGGETTTQ